MKALFLKSATLIGMVSLLAGCVSPDGAPNNTATGALIGGGAGAALGALADRRFPGAGALFGAAAGSITGALIGNSVDEQNARVASMPPPPSANYAPEPDIPALSLNDIKNLSHSGAGDDIIINQVIRSHAVYNLDANAILDLHNAGVSQRVITCLINTPDSPQTTTSPPPQAEAAPPAPNAVWIDGQWNWNGWVWVNGRWVWPPHPRAYWVAAHWESGPYGWHRVPGYWR